MHTLILQSIYVKQKEQSRYLLSVVYKMYYNFVIPRMSKIDME